MNPEGVRDVHFGSSAHNGRPIKSCRPTSSTTNGSTATCKTCTSISCTNRRVTTIISYKITGVTSTGWTSWGGFGTKAGTRRMPSRLICASRESRTASSMTKCTTVQPVSPLGTFRPWESTVQPKWTAVPCPSCSRWPTITGASAPLRLLRIRGTTSSG